MNHVTPKKSNGHSNTGSNTKKSSDSHSKRTKSKNHKNYHKSSRSKSRNKTKNIRKRTHSSLISTNNSRINSSHNHNLTSSSTNGNHTINHNHTTNNNNALYKGGSLPLSSCYDHLQPTIIPAPSFPSSKLSSKYSNLTRNHISKHNKKKRINSSNRNKYSHHHHRYNKKNNQQISQNLGPSKEKIIQYKKNLYSDDITKQLHAVSQLRILLSDEQQPPIDLVIRSNCIPRLIHILESRQSINLLFETAWVLTNICSGSHQHTMAVVEANGIECILSLLDLKDIAVLEQSIWVLGNIAGDGTNARDICLEKGVLTRLIRLAQEQSQLKTEWTTKVPPERRQNSLAIGNNGAIKQHETASSKNIIGNDINEMPLSFLRNFVWTISNLVRGKPQPAWNKVSSVIPIILLYLNCVDIEVLTDTCWALSYLSDGCNEHIQSILDLSMFSGIDISTYLVKFLDKKSMNVLVPALRTCGNIVSGSDHQTQQIIDRGLLTKLKRLLRHPNHSVKKEAIWTVSNITAGNPTQIQLVIDHGLIEPLVDILTDYHSDHDLVKEWAISNATTGGTTNQLRYLSQYASIGLSRVMSHFPCDKKLQLVLLEGLENLLSFTTENPIPLSQSPLANMLLMSISDHYKECDDYKESIPSSKDDEQIIKKQNHQKKQTNEKVVVNMSVNMMDKLKKTPSLTSINEETEEYIKCQQHVSEHYKNIEISVDKQLYDDGYDDIYDISSGDEEYVISDEYDIDEINGNQNYVAYIMEQTEANRILEKWFYDVNQDREVAHLAQKIYKRYFNVPYQF